MTDINYCTLTKAQLLSMLKDLYVQEAAARDCYWELRDGKSNGCLVGAPLSAIIIYDNAMNAAARELLEIENQIRAVHRWLG